MVEQRSPKPSVACSSRVSPAKRSPLGLLFFWRFSANRTRNAIATELHSVRLWVASDTTLCKYYLLALLFQSLCAFTSRVSPAKRSPLGLLFFGGFLRIEHATQSRRNYIPYACGLHLTRRFANTICSLCYFSRFALSRVSPAKRSPLGLLFFGGFRESNAQH